MKKKTIYSILALIIIIILFTTTAVCNTCAPLSSTEESDTDEKDTKDSIAEETEDTSALETTTIVTTSAETTTTVAANNPPEIAQIILPPTNMEVHRPYEIEVEATDADGDSLIYNWEVSGGTINDPASNPMIWTTPPFDGNYEITVTVNDGKGGTDTEVESVIIYPQPPPVISLDLPIDQKGYLAQGLICNGADCFVVVGDSPSNKPIRSYISFNIEDLGGTTVIDAILSLGDYIFVNDPSFVDGVFIDVVDWGDNELLVPGDYDLVGSLLAEQDIVAGGAPIKISTVKLRDKLQDAINNDRSNFQIRIIPRGVPSNNNNQFDAVQFKDQNIYLNVDFTGP
jgi:hypothetical protein